MAATDFPGGALTAYATTADGGDAASLATLVRATRPISGRGRKIFVQLRFATGAATCAVAVILHHTAGAASAAGSAVAVMSQTATATAYTDGTLYYSSVLVFETYNAPHYEVRVADPSAGAVNVYTWTG